MKLYCKALSPKIGREIPAPYYASPGAAALDLHACTDAAVTIPAGGRAVIPTGIAIALPGPEYVALIFARSGLGIKHGVAPPTVSASSTATTGGRFRWGCKTVRTCPTPFSPATASLSWLSSPSFRLSWSGPIPWTTLSAAPAASALRAGDLGRRPRPRKPFHSV